MPLFEQSDDAVRAEVYRRAVRARRNGTVSWQECLNGASDTVLVEMDIWLMAPGAAQ
ncbi:MAG: hypothetical protein WCO00_10120 [Rhodospirillaceae bacterium]